MSTSMVLEYGMGGTLGPVTIPRRHPLFLPEHPAYPAEGHREYSEATAQALDLETKKFLEERLEHVVQLLRDKRPLLDRLATMLLAKEVIEGEEFARIVAADSRVRRSAIPLSKRDDHLSGTAGSGVVLGSRSVGYGIEFAEDSKREGIPRRIE